jgi:hypothetical protein
MRTRALDLTKWVAARGVAAGLSALILTFAPMALRTVVMTGATSGTSQAGQCVVAQMDLSYTDAFSPAARDYVVSKVHVSNVPASCAGKTFVITVNGDSVGSGVFRGKDSVVDVNTANPVLASAVLVSGIGVSS